MNSNDIKNIEKLIEAFYEGETSPDEEIILYKFFSGQNIPTHLEKEKIVFIELKAIQDRGTASGLRKKLDSLIDKLEVGENLSMNNQSIHTSFRKRIDWRWVTSIAAAILIILTVGIFTQTGVKTEDSIAFTDTYSDPEDAYMETQKTLLYVSNKLNKGFDQMELVQRNIDKTNKIVEKNIQL